MDASKNGTRAHKVIPWYENFRSGSGSIEDFMRLPREFYETCRLATNGHWRKSGRAPDGYTESASGIVALCFHIARCKRAKPGQAELRKAMAPGDMKNHPIDRISGCECVKITPELLTSSFYTAWAKSGRYWSEKITRSELMNTIAVNSVGAAELAEIEEFYKTVGYGGGVSQSDFTLAARLDGSIVGAVRLCAENGVIVLRGMQVAFAFQRQGIGRALLDHCVPILNRGPAYCVPYEHLTDFYGQVGFIVTPPELLPAFLAERLAGYVATSRRTLAMKRMPA